MSFRKTIKAYLTDLDGVLRIWSSDINRNAELAVGLPERSLLRTAFAPDLLTPAITGQVTDEVWRQSIVTRLQRYYPEIGDDGAQRAVDTWSESAGEIDMAMLELIRSVRQHVPVVLVTNATTRLPADLQRLGILDDFDHIINSSAVGIVKPNAGIYQAALDAVGVSAADAFFVDDKAENVEAAVQLGMRGYVYKTIDGLRQVLGL